MGYRRMVFVFFILAYAFQAYAQLDSLHYRIETMTAFSNKGYLPLWIVSNRFGILEDEADALLRAGFDAPYRKGKKFDVSYGLDIIGKKDINKSVIQQGFLKVKYGVLEVRGGRIEETTGLPPEGLSSGSMAQSRNAMPIPKVAICIPEYASVPFTKGYLAFKGYWGHGWFGKGRAVNKAYLHEKNLYLKAGGDLPVNAYGGFVHYAIWGGESVNLGPLPSGFKDFLRIFQGKGASDAGEDGELWHEKRNALGNHLGIYDFGLVGKLSKYKLSVYHQTPWEDLSSLKLFKSKDRLVGMHLLAYNKKKVIAELVYEYIYTMYQSGPGMPEPVPGKSNFGYSHGGRDNYYDNQIYASGWSYKNNIIGTPIFITNVRFWNYFDELQNWRTIVNNRVVAHHVGIGGALGNSTSYKAKATYSRNHGTYSGLGWAIIDPDINIEELDYIFYPSLDQFYFLVEFNTVLPFNKNISWQTALGYDIGEMSKNFGVLLGLQWNGILNKNFKKR